MENFKKLSRAEMKEVNGGNDQPVCKGLCGDGLGECKSGCDCTQIYFPDGSHGGVCE